MTKNLFITEATKGSKELEAEALVEREENARYDVASVKQAARQKVRSAEKTLKDYTRAFIEGTIGAAAVIEAQDAVEYTKKCLKKVEEFEAKYFGKVE